MAIKDSYAIRTSLNRTYWDHEIDLSTAQLNSLLVSVKSVAFYGGTLALGSWLIFASPLSSASVFWRILLGIWLLAFAIYYGRYTKTKRLRIQQLSALPDYTKAKRSVATRAIADAADFRSIVGVELVETAHGSDGVIRFLDNSFGKAYRVSGSASVLVFDEARDAIVNRYARFWVKMDPAVELMSFTSKEPQPVYQQVASWVDRMENLKYSDPDLLKIAETKRRALVNYEGETYSSIQQYLLLRAPSLEQLRQADALLKNEIAESTLVFKTLREMNAKDTTKLLGSIYQKPGTSYTL